MKYQEGQTVQLLNTEFKPVCHATVVHYDAESGKYEVRYHYPDPDNTDTINVPQERLMLLTGTTNKTRS